MIDLCGIVAVDTDRRIVKRGQQVLPDIADLGGVLFEAVKDKADMLRIELQKPGIPNLNDFINSILLFTISKKSMLDEKLIEPANVCFSGFITKFP